MNQRISKIDRKTGETHVSVQLNLDGKGTCEVDTGIGFFDHMLHLFSVHSLIDLKLIAKGDLQVDPHHTVEDAGIALGKALLEAIGDKSGIKRYGTAYVPLDEALARTVIDFCDRVYLDFQNDLTGSFAGTFPGELVEDFLHAFASNARCTLHCDILKGRNVHHKIEVVFKSLGQATRIALSKDERRTGIPSSKGVL